MQLFLCLILICSIWTLGLTIASQEGMILYSWREWADSQWQKGHDYQEALIRCYFCMPSVHSLVAYMFAYGMGLIHDFSWRLVVIYPLVVCGASILNGLVWGAFVLIKNMADYYDISGIVEQPKEMPHEHHKIHHN